MLLMLAATTSVTVLFLVLLPFFVGEGGTLQAAASVDSVDRLEAMKKALLKRYLEEETAVEKALITPRLWGKRKLFLINRYIDAARRLDFVKYLESLKSEKGGSHG